MIKRLIETIGQHPFVTGLLAILGFLGFWVSIVGFDQDRREAAQTSEQIAEGFDDTNRLVDTTRDAVDDTRDALDNTRDAVDDTRDAVATIDQRLEQADLGRQGSYQDGTFLFEDPVEGVYSNFWTAYTNRMEPSPELTIRGEGKTVEFSGVIVLNCSNYKYVWRGGANFGEPLTEEQIKSLVPEPAIRATTRIFCWDKG